MLYMQAHMLNYQLKGKIHKEQNHHAYYIHVPVGSVVSSVEFVGGVVGSLVGIVVVGISGPLYDATVLSESVTNKL